MVWWLIPVCAGLCVVFYHIMRYTLKRAKFDGITEKYNFVVGKEYKIVLNNGKVYNIVVFTRIYDFLNQYMGDVVKVNGKYKVVKANIGLAFTDKNTKKEIRIKAALIRQVTRLDTGETIDNSALNK